MDGFKNKKQTDLLELMSKYVTDDVLDISKFRNENPKEYNKLSYYFGSIDDAIKAGNWVKKRYANNSINNLTLRNKLALIKLNELYEKYTYEEIGIKYNVSKAAVSQLHKNLLNIKE